MNILSLKLRKEHMCKELEVITDNKIIEDVNRALSEWNLNTYGLNPEYGTSILYWCKEQLGRIVLEMEDVCRLTYTYENKSIVSQEETYVVDMYAEDIKWIPATI